MTPPPDDETPMRRRLLETVRRYPGLHLRELARQLETSVALVEYHIPHLEEAGLVERVVDRRTHRIYPAGEELPRRLVALLRDPKRLQVALHLLDRGPMSHARLVRATGMGKSTLSFHLRQMEDLGVVANSADGYILVDPQRVQRILQRHRPTPDLLDRFANTWNDLYGA